MSHTYKCGNDRVFYEKDSVRAQFLRQFPFSQLPVGRISFDLEYTFLERDAGLGPMQPMLVYLVRADPYGRAKASAKAWKTIHLEYDITPADTVVPQPWVVIVQDAIDWPQPDNPRLAKHRPWTGTCTVAIPWPVGATSPFPPPPPPPPAELIRDSLREPCRTSHARGKDYERGLDWKRTIQLWGPGTIEAEAVFTPFDSNEHKVAGVFVSPPATLFVNPSGDPASPKVRYVDGPSPLRRTFQIADSGARMWDVSFFATKDIKYESGVRNEGNQRVTGVCAFTWQTAFPLQLRSLTWADDPDPGIVTLRFEYEWTAAVERALYGTIKGVWLNLYSGTGGDVSSHVVGVSRGEHGAWRTEGARQVYSAATSYRWAGPRPVDLSAAIAVETERTVEGQGPWSGATRPRVTTRHVYTSSRKVRVHVGATQFGTIVQRNTGIPSAADKAVGSGKVATSGNSPGPISKPASAGSKAVPSAAPRKSVPTTRESPGPSGPIGLPRVPVTTPPTAPSEPPPPRSPTGSFRVTVSDGGIRAAGTKAWFCREPVFVLTLEKEGFNTVIGGVAAPRSGAYPVSQDTGSGKFFIAVGNEEPLRGYAASSGTLTITLATETRLVGRFSAFARPDEEDRTKDVTLTGSFDAVPGERC